MQAGNDVVVRRALLRTFPMNLVISIPIVGIVFAKLYI